MPAVVSSRRTRILQREVRTFSQQVRTVTGELERASETLELYRQAYPRDYRAASNLANVDSMLGHIYVRSELAGPQVMESVTRFITQRLKLKVNAAKSAVARPQKRKFLGFSFTASPEIQRAIAPKALDRFKQRIRDITRRAKRASA